ncbi:MAG: DNA repair protein RecN [Ruminococcaceae bacterium]|nr:DNA repair protein RecN [Oscillospiraceae bacterium]
MLKALSIQNIAVAKNLNIDFFDGFTVLTGKTGAGKSVIIDSIALLLGAKGQRDLIRQGERTASVTAVFDGTPGDGGFDENGELTIERTLSQDGRSTVKINGKSASLSAMKETAVRLLALHGQNDTVSLYDRGEHIILLDGYADCQDDVLAYGEIYSELCAKKSEMAELERSLEDRSMMTDILKYQISDIEKVRIQDPAEEEKLEKLRTKIKSLEHVTKNANLVYRALAPGEKGASAAYLLERASSALRQLSEVMDNAEELAMRLDEYRYELIDIAEQARDVIDSDEVADPEKQLDIIESRLAAFQRLKKKYGGSLEDVIAFRDDAKRKLRDLEGGEDRMEELRLEYRILAKKATAAADIISEKRREAGGRLAGEVMATLKSLDMPKVRFFVDIRKTQGEDKFNSRGTDEVDFTVITNPGEEAQPLYKIASGGELSRIMLALKCAQTKKSAQSTVIFDEIDTGVSGGTAERIGMKLRALAENIQVICVTHSAQVSAHADNHYLIEKNEVEGRMESSVRTLDGEERVAELARIIGGINVTEMQYSAARDLLKKN